MKSPVFVVGAQRTGSTLIGRMLASIPGSAVTVNGKVVYNLLLYIPRTPNWVDWIEHLRIDEIVHSINRKPPILAPDKFTDHMIDGLSKGRRDLLGNLSNVSRGEAIAYLAQSVYSSINPRHSLWGDKYNEYVLQLGDLHCCFPNATLVWTVRDAAAAGASAVSAFAGRPWAPLTRQEAIKRTERWSSLVAAFAAERPNVSIVRVEAERLISDPVAELSMLDTALELGGALPSLSSWVIKSTEYKNG